MALVTGLVNEMFGHRLVVIWLWFGHTRLVRMWSVNVFGHRVGTTGHSWLEIGQTLLFLLGLISLVIAYDQDILGQSLTIATHDQ